MMMLSCDSRSGKTCPGKHKGSISKRTKYSHVFQSCHVIWKVIFHTQIQDQGNHYEKEKLDQIIY